MRLVAWNCNMALHRKFAALRSLHPDIAVIGECAEPGRLAEQGLLDRLSDDPVWIGSNPHKGLAVLAFNGYRLRLLDAYDPALRFVAPVRVEGRTSFNLLAAWAQNANDGIRRRDQPGPVRLALDRYRDFLVHGPAVLAGDLNNHVQWDKPGWPMNQQAAVEVLDGLGLVSGYHALRGEAQGAERTPTHYWRDRKKHGPRYHIDYIFFSRGWLPRVRRFSVGGFEKWCGSGLSDHVPLALRLADG